MYVYDKKQIYAKQNNFICVTAMATFEKNKQFKERKAPVQINNNTKENYNKCYVTG